MTDEEVAYAASLALMELEADSVVISVGRLAEKPFGWVVVFEGSGGARDSMTFEHRAEEPRGALKEKIKAALAARGG